LDIDSGIEAVTSANDLVVVGRIRRSHGLLGVVVVEPMTASPELVFAAERELVAGTVKGEAAVPPRVLRIEMAEPFQGGFRVQFDAIGDRNEADRWRDRYVLSPRADLPEPRDDEVYLYDLIGLTAEATNGEIVGRVQAYYQLKHDLMIEIARTTDTVMIPYRFVIEVDLEGKRVVVDPPDGLL
jgi:16S rRNA processing protein RimM